MKETFLMSVDDSELINDLDNEQAGILLKSLMNYQLGLEILEMDKLTSMVFKVMKRRIDKNNAKYEETCAARSAAGKKGGRPKKINENDDSDAIEEKAKKTNAFSEKQNKTKKADNEYEYDSDNDIKKESVKEKRVRFSPPSESEVAEYSNSLGYTGFNSSRFIDFYESKGWMVGKNKMKDWKAAVRNWHKGDNAKTRAAPNKFNNFEQRNDDYDALAMQLIANQAAIGG